MSLEVDDTPSEPGLEVVSRPEVCKGEIYFGYYHKTVNIVDDG